MDIKGKHGKPSLPERLACNYSEKKAEMLNCQGNIIRERIQGKNEIPTCIFHRQL